MNTNDQPLAPDLRATLRRYVDVVGDARACALLGLSLRALERALAGSPVRRGTVAAVRLGLAEAIADATPAALLTIDDIARARGDGRPLGEVADARAREAQGGQ
jgi:hypothetical protein